MASILNLPPELRLQIYEHLLSRHPYHIYIDEYFAKDCQPEWIQLKQLLRFDPTLASEITRIYWQANTFMIPEVNTIAGIDGETSSWINDHVVENLKDLRFLEFGFSARCPAPRADLSNAVCYNVVSIDILREKAKLSNSGRRGDGCAHVEAVVRRLVAVLANRPFASGQKLLTENDFWQLYRSCGD